MPRGRQYYDPIIQAPSRVETPGARRIELYPEGDVTDAAPGPLRWVARLIGDDGLIVEKTEGSFDHDDALRQAQELWPGLEVFELREESEDSTHEGMGPSPRLWQRGTAVGPPMEFNDGTKRYSVDVPADQEAIEHARTFDPKKGGVFIPEPTSIGDISKATDALRKAGHGPLEEVPPVAPSQEEKDALIAGIAANVQVAPDGARQLRAIVAADPGSYVHLDDIVLVLEDYAAQYDGQGNPSGALALREAAAALREPF